MDVLYKAKTLSADTLGHEWVRGFPFLYMYDGFPVWCIGCSPLSSNDYSELVGDYDMILEDTLCQSICKKDSNGVDLFEKDLVEYESKDKSIKGKALIVRDRGNCCFRLYDLKTLKPINYDICSLNLTAIGSSLDYNSKLFSKVSRFDGEYFFLSNFYQVPVKYNGVLYFTSEAAFQAQKCPERANEFSVILNPARAKKLGKNVTLRKDWDRVKDKIMYQIVKEKFLQHSELREKLLNTGFAVLEEGNEWNDHYWGVCKGRGLNKLGLILMQIRDEFRNN